MTFLNHTLSRLFNGFASIYEYIGASERFRALAYKKASLVLDGLKDDISSYIRENVIEGVAGIGESISEKIVELSGRAK